MELFLLKVAKWRMNCFTFSQATVPGKWNVGIDIHFKSLLSHTLLDYNNLRVFHDWISPSFVRWSPNESRWYAIFVVFHAMFYYYFCCDICIWIITNTQHCALFSCDIRYISYSCYDIRYLKKKRYSILPDFERFENTLL